MLWNWLARGWTGIFRMLPPCCPWIVAHQALCPWDFPDNHRITRVRHNLVTKLWPSHAKSWLIGENSDAGRDWGQEEKGTTEDEMAGWLHWLDGRESEWTPGVGDGQGGLLCCDSWGRKGSDTTERLNWTETTTISLPMLKIPVKKQQCRKRS